MRVLMVIEWLVAACNSIWICVWDVFNTIDIRGYLEYPCGFQCYLCLCSLLLYPLLLLCSLWKRIIRITRYGFLVIGSLLILSGVVILVTCFAYLGVHDTFMYLVCGGSPISKNSSLLLMMLVSGWGADSIIRYWCCSRYNHVLFAFSLFRNHYQSSRNYWRLTAVIGIYIAAYVIVFCHLL